MSKLEFSACGCSWWMTLAGKINLSVQMSFLFSLFRYIKSCNMRFSTYPAFSSSSSFDPDPVFVGRSSSGTILELLLLPSMVVSANLFVCAIFSIMLPPAVKSDILCFLAARCFFALVRSAWNGTKNATKFSAVVKYKSLIWDSLLYFSADSQTISTQVQSLLIFINEPSNSLTSLTTILYFPFSLATVKRNKSPCINHHNKMLCLYRRSVPVKYFSFIRAWNLSWDEEKE